MDHPNTSARRVRRKLSVWLGSAAALTFSLSTQAAVVGSDFEDGIDGWLGYICPNPGNCTGESPVNNITLVPNGGSPPGGGAPEAGNQYIHTVDPGENDAARVEPNPAKFEPLYTLGRVLSFDVLVRSNGGGGEYDLGSFGAAPLVAIEVPNAVLVYTVSAADLPVIDGDWKHYDVPLVNDTNWFLVTSGGIGQPSDAQFGLAIDNLVRLTIISEWLKEVDEIDTGGVDNFSVVPVPAALPLFGSALLLAGIRRRRSR